MSLGSRLARLLWKLPERRCEAWLERLWIPAPDGTRLATLHFWPVGVSDAAVVLIRTADGALGSGRATRLLAALLAERGYHVVLQDVRGRSKSEGRFEPFLREAGDGGAALEWLAAQGWCDGRIAVVGMGYAGYAAWAALAEAPERVRAIAVGFATADPYAALYPGGAFALATALAWSVGAEEDPSGLDLARAHRHRPVLESDRVALRRNDAYRSWVEHPRRDAVWDAARIRVPSPPPPALLLAGWRDACLAAQLRDYEALAQAAAGGAGPAPRLVVGAWSGPESVRERRRAASARQMDLAPVALRELSAFLDRHLGKSGSAAAAVAPVRYVAGEAFRETQSWPPPGVEPRALYLRAADGSGAGRALRWEAPDEAEPPDRYAYDPENPVPSAAGLAGAQLDQRLVEGRPDVLSYTSDPLERDLEIAGSLRAVFYVESSAPDTDFSAKLVDVRPDGCALWVSEGIARARWRERAEEEKEPHWLEPGRIVRLEVELAPAARRFPTGHALRLEVSSSSVPRFDRNANTRETTPALCGPEASQVAQQAIHHCAERPSHLLLPVCTAPGPIGPNAKNERGGGPSAPPPLLATSGRSS